MRLSASFWRILPAPKARPVKLTPQIKLALGLGD
jgi:hypothetical protein